MIFSKYASKCFLRLIMPFALIACVPLPWSKVEYKALDVDRFTVRNLPDPQGTYGYLWVNQAFIKVAAVAHDQTTESGSPPYLLGIVAYGENDKHSELIVHQIKAQNDSGKVFQITPTLREYDDGQLNVEPLAFPANVAFNTLSNPPKYWSFAYLATQASIYPDVKNNEKFKVDIDLEVVSTTSRQRKTLSYTFAPHTKSGLFRSLD